MSERWRNPSFLFSTIEMKTGIICMIIVKNRGINMRKEDVTKFKKSCEVAKSKNDNDKTSFEIRVFDYNTSNVFYKTLTKKEFIALIEEIDGISDPGNWC